MRLLRLLALACPLAAQTGQQFHELRDLRLESGDRLASCRIGYRTYGTLNAERSNAVLFPTWFTGKSADLEGFMGGGKLVDSTRYFVITVDALANGVSCSPSNSAGTFPPVTVRDMVNSQHRLLREHFGLKRLHAVMGISMGGMQTFEWMTAYPGFAERAVPIIGSPRQTSTDLLLWQAELSAIESAETCRCDPRTAMRAVQAIHEFALRTPNWRARDTPPGDFGKLMGQLAERAEKGMDPRDWAAQLRAMMAHDVASRFGGSLEKAAEAVKARALIVVATQDHMVNPLPALEFARLMKADTLELTGDCGHMATACESARMTAAVSQFLGQTNPSPRR